MGQLAAQLFHGQVCVISSHLQGADKRSRVHFKYAICIWNLLAVNSQYEIQRAVTISEASHHLSGMSDRRKPITRPDSGSSTKGFINCSSWLNRQGSSSANRDVEGSSGSVVVRQVWVRSVQTKAWFQGVGRVVVEGQTWVGAGQTKAWFQVVGRVGVGGRRGSEPGRRRRRRGSRADGDCSGRGYWDTDRDWNGRRRRTETETANSLGAKTESAWND